MVGDAKVSVINKNQPGASARRGVPDADGAPRLGLQIKGTYKSSAKQGFG